MTISFYLTLPLLIGVAMLQTTLLARVDLWGGRPDLMFLMVLGWTLVRGVDEGLIWAFVGGLIIDLLSGGPLGATALALVSAAFLAGQPLGQGIGSAVARTMLLAFLGVLAHHLVLLIVLDWTGYTVNWRFSLTRVAGPSALLNALLIPFVQQPLTWLEQRIGREGFAL